MRAPARADDNKYIAEEVPRVARGLYHPLSGDLVGPVDDQTGLCPTQTKHTADFHRLCGGIMALQAFETKNSSVDGHAVNDNFVCVPNRHINTVEETKKVKGKSLLVRDNLEVFDVDVHHYFEETYPKGKKTVHAMHNICLDNTINFYRDA